MKTLILIISFIFFSGNSLYSQSHTFYDNVWMGMNECISISPQKTNTSITISEIEFNKYTVNFKQINYILKYSHSEILSDVV